MKTTNQCPKCGSKDLLRIPYSSGAELSVPEGSGSWRPVPVVRYVCGGCGYIEEWVENKDDLEKLRREYEHKQ
jgi:hypothetical protein